MTEARFEAKCLIRSALTMMNARVLTHCSQHGWHADGEVCMCQLWDYKGKSVLHYHEFARINPYLEPSDWMPYDYTQ